MLLLLLPLFLLLLVCELLRVVLVYTSLLLLRFNSFERLWLSISKEVTGLFAWRIGGGWGLEWFSKNGREMLLLTPIGLRGWIKGVVFWIKVILLLEWLIDVITGWFKFRDDLFFWGRSNPWLEFEWAWINLGGVFGILGSFYCGWILRVRIVFWDDPLILSFRSFGDNTTASLLSNDYLLMEMISCCGDENILLSILSD